LIEKRPAETVTIWPTAEELAAGVQKGLWVKIRSPYPVPIGSDRYQATALLKACMVMDSRLSSTTLNSGVEFGIKVGEIGTSESKGRRSTRSLSLLFGDLETAQGMSPIYVNTSQTLTS
jgi:hypothetical protein